MKRIIFYLLVIFASATSAKNIDRSFIIEDNCITKGKDRIVIPDLNDKFIILTSDTVLTFSTNAHFPEEGIYSGEDFYSAFRPHVKFEISYFLQSKSRDIDITFYHSDYNLDVIRQRREPVPTDTMKILILPKSFLERITPVDMDKKFPEMKDKQESHEFIRSLERKRVWIIDRRYMTDSTLTLVETKVRRVPHTLDIIIHPTD